MAPDSDVLDVIALDARPDAVIHLAVMQAAAATLGNRDVLRGGIWHVTATYWRRYDRPWLSATDPGGARLLGTVYVLHSYPSPYEALVHRVTVTPTGAALGWGPEQIVDDALACVDMRLADCPRSERTPAHRLPLARI